MRGRESEVGGGKDVGGRAGTGICGETRVWQKMKKYI